MIYQLVSNLTSNAINKFERKIGRKGAVGAENEFYLFISNEDMNDIIKIIKWLEDSGVLIAIVTETVKHEIKSKKADFLVFASTFSGFISATSNFFSSKNKSGDRRTGREHKKKNI